MRIVSIILLVLAIKLCPTITLGNLLVKDYHGGANQTIEAGTVRLYRFEGLNFGDTLERNDDEVSKADDDHNNKNIIYGNNLKHNYPHQYFRSDDGHRSAYKDYQQELKLASSKSTFRKTDPNLHKGTPDETPPSLFLPSVHRRRHQLHHRRDLSSVRRRIPIEMMTPQEIEFRRRHCDIAACHSYIFGLWTRYEEGQSEVFDVFRQLNYNYFKSPAYKDEFCRVFYELQTKCLKQHCMDDVIDTQPVSMWGLYARAKKLGYTLRYAPHPLLEHFVLVGPSDFYIEPRILKVICDADWLPTPPIEDWCPLTHLDQKEYPLFIEWTYQMNETDNKFSSFVALSAKALKTTSDAAQGDLHSDKSPEANKLCDGIAWRVHLLAWLTYTYCGNHSEAAKFQCEYQAAVLKVHLSPKSEAAENSPKEQPPEGVYNPLHNCDIDCSLREILRTPQPNKGLCMFNTQTENDISEMCVTFSNLTEEINNAHDNIGQLEKEIKQQKKAHWIATSDKFEPGNNEGKAKDVDPTTRDEQTKRPVTQNPKQPNQYRQTTERRMTPTIRTSTSPSPSTAITTQFHTPIDPFVTSEPNTDTSIENEIEDPSEIDNGTNQVTSSHFALAALLLVIFSAIWW